MIKIFSMAFILAILVGLSDSSLLRQEQWECKYFLLKERVSGFKIKYDCENSNDYTVNSILSNVQRCKNAPEFLRTSNSCKLKNNIIYCGDRSVNISSVVSFSSITKRLICSQ